MRRRTVRSSNARARGIAAGYRSGLEESIGASLQRRGAHAKYEPFKIDYTQPESWHHYTPDWQLPNGIIVESKGRFLAADRKKHLLVQAQHPDKDIRFVFQRSATRISKKSATTYAAWCIKHGFKYADKDVPDAWLKEKPQ